MIVMMAKDGPPSVTVPTVPTVPTEEDMKAIRAVKDEDLPWIPPSPEVGPGEKLLTKMKENPFVPVGCLATVAALTFGLFQFKRGNLARSQLAMRLRVVAQGGTVIALVMGVMWSSRKQPTTQKKN